MQYIYIYIWGLNLFWLRCVHLITLPFRLPGNPCFPSGNLPGLRCLKYFLIWLLFWVGNGTKKTLSEPSKWGPAPICMFLFSSMFLPETLPGSFRGGWYIIFWFCRPLDLGALGCSRLPWDKQSKYPKTQKPTKTLPIKLPRNPCFPSGDLPGCSVLACSRTRKKQHVLAKNRLAIN